MEKKIVTAEILRDIHRSLRELGHLPLRQGACFECARCGASGTAYLTARQHPPAGWPTTPAPLPGVAITGQIARVRCGENEIGS